MPSPSSGLKTRQALIDAAKGFLGQGNSDVSIQDIAKAADVSVGSVYTYFADKNDLFEVAANEAREASTAPLMKVAHHFADPGLGYIALSLYACKRPVFDPETAQIIVSMGPIGFARSTDYLAPAMTAVQQRIDSGFATIDDAEAFVVAVSGAYQNVLAHHLAGTASPGLDERVIWNFAHQLGYSHEEYQTVVDYVASL